MAMVEPHRAFGPSRLNDAILAPPSALLGPARTVDLISLPTPNLFVLDLFVHPFVPV